MAATLEKLLIAGVPSFLVLLTTLYLISYLIEKHQDTPVPKDDEELRKDS